MIALSRDLLFWTKAAALVSKSLFLMRKLAYRMLGIINMRVVTIMMNFVLLRTFTS